MSGPGSVPTSFRFPSIPPERRSRGSRTQAIDVWRAASEELRSTLGDSNFETWFGGLEPVELKDSELVIAVADEYTRDWLVQRLAPVVRNALAVAGYPDVVPTYIIEEQPEVEAPRRRAEAKTGFNPHYTFEEFIVGSGNRLAHASALATVDRPGQVYNPLVLYGGVGVGKTHLLQAIGQEAIDQGTGHGALHHLRDVHQ